MNPGLYHLGIGLMVALGSLSAMLATSALSSSFSSSNRFIRKNLAFGLCLASLIIGTAVSGHGVGISNLIFSAFGVVSMCVLVYASFGGLTVPVWFPVLGLVPMLVLGLFMGMPLMIVDAMLTALPFGISAIVLRGKRLFVSEAIVCGLLGAFFGVGLGLVTVTFGTTIAAVIARKDLAAVERMALSGWMCVAGLVVTLFAAVIVL